MANSQTKVSLNDTLFPVREAPALYIETNIKKSKQETLHRQNGHKFVIREDTGEVISCMTDNYQLVSNKEVIDKVLPVMNKTNATFKEAQIFSDGARTKWTWTYQDISVDVGNKDILHPEITIQNSYDGSWELSFLAGAFRLVCSNGLTIGTIVDTKRNRHSVYNTNLLKIDEMIADTVDKCENVFVDEFGQLINTVLKKADISKVVKELPQQAIDPFVKYLQRESKNMNNYWDLLNAFTWVTSHALNRRHESTNKLEKKVYPLIRSLARA